MLESCPQCSYSLTGLPAEYTCPECGLRYDEQSAVWHTPKYGWGCVIGLMFIVGGGLKLVGACLTVTSLRDPYWYYVVDFGLALAWLGLGCLILHKTFQGHPYVAVLPGGVCYTKIVGRPKWVPWEEIADAYGNYRMSWRWGWAQLVLKSGRRINIYQPYLSLARSQDFARCVRERIKSNKAPTYMQNGE